MSFECIRCGRIVNDNEMEEGCKCGSKMFVEINDKITNVVNDNIDYGNRLENVTIVNKGIFELNLKSIPNEYVIVKDEQGIYYVKLPYMARPVN